MLSCINRFLRSFRRSQQINPAGQQYPCSSDLTTELDRSHTFSLNSLMALLPILAVSGPDALQPVALTLVIYTISLRLAINSRFSHDYPTLSRFLHAIPLLGTFCMAGVALVFGLQSPVLAAIGLFLGVLPLLTIVTHHGMLCIETSPTELPMPAAAGSVDTTLASH